MSEYTVVLLATGSDTEVTEREHTRIVEQRSDRADQVSWDHLLDSASSRCPSRHSSACALSPCPSAQTTSAAYSLGAYHGVGTDERHTGWQTHSKPVPGRRLWLSLDRTRDDKRVGLQDERVLK